jgi:NAD(P)H dehydrogenase (quinone)
MKIGVGGASGKLGQAVIRELQARAPEQTIVAISRTPATAPAGVEARYADYELPETLSTAYAGLDRLLLIPTTDLRPGKRGVQNAAAINAAVAAGVKHIVQMSAAGTRLQQEPALGASYWTAEQQLIRTAPAWTILRMNYYAESLADEAKMSAAQGVLTGIGENKVAFVSRDDVAAAAAGILIGEGHEGSIYTATGPRTYSGNERAAIISDISGSGIGFAQIAAQTLRDGMTHAGLPIDVVNVVLAIQEDFVNGAFDIVTGDVEKLAGRQPRDLPTALRAAFA